jgi:thioesterase domain-containing protein
MVIQESQIIQAYLYEQIPLSKAMEVKVVEVSSDRVILSAPIQPNINHRETVFGGSASALTILTAWTLINFRLKREGISTRLVIQKNTIGYEKPIVSDFEAVCTLDNLEIWQKFIAILYKKKREVRSFVAIANNVLQKCIEIRDRYLLLVYWNTLEDHTIGFRQSEQYQTWKQLLHHFYEPFPVVEHYYSAIAPSNNN